MLQELRSAGAAGPLILTDSASLSARRFLHSLIVAALQRGDVVHLFSFEFPAEDFLAGLPDSASSRLLLHDGFSDPLGWKEGSSSPLLLDDITVTTLRAGLGGGVAARVTVVIDSLSWIVARWPLPRVCRFLRDLSHTPDGCGEIRLVTLLHADLHSPGVLQSLCSLAGSALHVAPAEGEAQLVSIVQRMKSGKILNSTERVRILEDLSLQIIAESQSETPLGKPQADPTDNLTFNLRLSEEERERRETTNLPYTFSQSKKSSLLQGGSGSARIFYDPEPIDDVDDEDPDDDLDV